MDLTTLPINTAKRSRPVDPLEIFGGLTLRGTINDLWGPQIAALTEWHAKRTNPDNVIQMNTGGGKTPVGMLIAQSLVNETRGRVLYVCPTNQLVEQTAKRAVECGLDVALRMKGNWIKREVFQSAESFCITNYAAVFNGFSPFLREDITALVFDDAHVAEPAIRQQFTLKLPQQHPAFNKIADLFRPHFANSSLASTYEDVFTGRGNALVFVPMYVVWRQAEAIRRLMLEHGVAEDDECKWAWECVKDNLATCCVLLSGKRLEITPCVLPVHRLPYFGPNVRRIYLTATLPSQIALIRTFGLPNPEVIEPKGKLGEAQRLFIFVPGEDDDEQREAAQGLVRNVKACVISPALHRAETWCPPAQVFDRRNDHSDLDRFAASRGVEKLAMVARYDGVDLPGEACRVLVFDGLPFGENLLDRFLDERMQVETLRLSHMAARLVQGMGRIFRSNTDHGAVLLCGNDLQNWVRNPRNQRFLPKLLQQQLALAEEFQTSVTAGKATHAELLEAVLSGRKDWDQTYSTYIEQFETVNPEPPTPWYGPLVEEERAAYLSLWDGHWTKAADLYARIAEQAEAFDRRVAAWYRHWEGYAHLRAGNEQAALVAFLNAANVRSELGRPTANRDVLRPADPSVKPSTQAIRIAEFLRRRASRVPVMLAATESGLATGSDSKVAEAALADLGTLLGLESSRPDAKERTGPDIVWLGDGEPGGVVIEAKTNKKPDGEYSKDDIGQCHDHGQWWRERHPTRAFRLAIVGPHISVSKQAHPPVDLQIVETGQFRDLTQRVKQLYEVLQSSTDAATLDREAERWLAFYGLRWPQCFDSLESLLATDTRRSEAEGL